MRVAVMGAAGTLGRAAVPALVQAGHRVRAIVRSPEDLDDPRLSRAEPLQGDVLDRTTIAETLDGIDAVLYCVDFRARHFERHWDAVRHVLEGLGASGHLVCPGSASVFGPTAGERAGPEHPRTSRERLDRLWVELERAVLAQGGTLIYLPEVYGYGMSRGWTRAAVRRGMRGRTVWYPGDLDRPRELLYLEDAARALVAPFGVPAARGAAYTAPGPRPITPREFFSLVAAAAGTALRLRSLPPSLPRALLGLHPDGAAIRRRLRRLEWCTLLDGEPIRRALGWVPEVDHAEAVRRTVNRLSRSDRG